MNNIEITNKELFELTKSTLNDLEKYIYPEQMQDWVKFVIKAYESDNKEVIIKTVELIKEMSNSKYKTDNEYKFNTHKCSFNQYIWIFNPACYFSKDGSDIYKYLLGYYTVKDATKKINKFTIDRLDLLEREKNKYDSNLIATHIKSKMINKYKKEGLKEYKLKSGDIFENYKYIKQLKNDNKSGFVVLNNKAIDLFELDSNSLKLELFNVVDDDYIKQLEINYNKIRKNALNYIEEKYLDDFYNLVNEDFNNKCCLEFSMNVLEILKSIKTSENLKISIDLLKSKNYTKNYKNEIVNTVLKLSKLGPAFYARYKNSQLTKEEKIYLEDYINKNNLRRYKEEYKFYLMNDLSKDIENFAFCCANNQIIYPNSVNKLIKFLYKYSSNLKMSPLVNNIKELLFIIDNDDGDYKKSLDYLDSLNLEANLLADLKRVILECSFKGIDFYLSCKKNKLSINEQKKIKEIEIRNEDYNYSQEQYKKSSNKKSKNINISN